MPTVSVIIPAYNAAKDVGRAIESCLRQNAAPLEILVVDDGSSDDIEGAVAGFPASVRLLRKPNGGPASARNLGAREARGDWLALLDADDEWHPEKLEQQLALDSAEDIGLIHGLANTSKPNIPDRIDFDLLWRANLIVNSSVLIRASAFASLGGFDEDRRLISVEDYNLWLRLAHTGWQIVTCRHLHTFYTRGVGISSNTTRFLDASLYNVDALERDLQLPAELCGQKRLQIRDAFGASALFERRTRLARSLFARTLIDAPSPRRAIRLAAACLPVAILDARRHLVEGRTAPSSHLAPAAIDVGNQRPLLLAVVDVMAEGPSIEPLQRLFERHELVPTYVLDQAAAAATESHAPLLAALAAGRCHVGALSDFRDSRPADEAQAFRTLEPLTALIERNLGSRPLLHHARGGSAPPMARALDALGYQIDTSNPPMPEPGGWPRWSGPTVRLLEAPITAGFVGPLLAADHGFAAAILMRLGLLQRRRLATGEISLVQAQRLTRTLLHKHGHRIFVLNVAVIADRAPQDWLDAYLAFFLGPFGGSATTAPELHRLAETARRDGS